jgi:hypothetical protein
MTKSIRGIKQKYEAGLLRLPGVVSVGIGLDKDDKQAIIVGLETPMTALDTRFPNHLEGIPVIYKTTGRIKAR